MKSRQQGFTLVELIVVIVILGILAATALPKFFDLSKEARGGVMKGVEAAMRGADTMIYAKSLATGALSATGSVSVNGASVPTVYGYAKDAKELAATLDLNPAADFDTADTARIAHKKAKDYATSPGNCAVAYTPATSSAPPQYVLTETGC